MIVNTSDPGHQIMPMAKRLVRCPCGYGHDSYADTDEEAVVEIAAQHPCDPSTYAVEVYTCRPHQSVGKCRECAR